MKNDARRVLIVTNAAPPTMLADMHRARMLADELPKEGWNVELLVPGRQFQRPLWVEPDAMPFVPEHVPIHEVSPVCEKAFRYAGVRSVGWRAFWPMYKAGCRLLQSRHFDVVYITTAQFCLFNLGKLWTRRFQVPYVLDYHDPWVNDHCRYMTTDHRYKRRIVSALARCMERSAIGAAAGVVSVSPDYLDQLRQRYGAVSCLKPERSIVIPFAGSERDFVVPNPVPLSKPRLTRNVVYVGAGGAIMVQSFTAICEALAAVRRNRPELIEGLKLQLFGTYAYWKEGDPKPLYEIAARLGLGGVIEENPARVSYMTALELTCQSDGLFVLGVDDPAYVPSKLFNYALSGKPLLACMRCDSPVVKMFNRLPGLGHLMSFGNGEVSGTDNIAAMSQFLTDVSQTMRFDRRDLISEYLAPNMARRHRDLFEHICSSGRAS